MDNNWTWWWWPLLFSTIVHDVPFGMAEIEQIWSVSELAPVGHRIGWIMGDGPPENLQQQNFYIVFPNPDSHAEHVSG